MNKQEIFKMLREESGAFATEDEDIECAAQLKLEINLRKDNPVQKHTQFNSQALVWRGKETPAGYDQSWMDKQIEVTLIIPSCVREGKRWQSETVNYRQLKCKIEDDCQPIPRIRDILNSLSGDTYFPVLDQGKPYDQGFVTEEHWHLTAFITPWGLYQRKRIWSKKCTGSLPEVHGETPGGPPWWNMYPIP